VFIEEDEAKLGQMILSYLPTLLFHRKLFTLDYVETQILLSQAKNLKCKRQIGWEESEIRVSGFFVLL
jgi:hypothetical protein